MLRHDRMSEEEKAPEGAAAEALASRLAAAGDEEEVEELLRRMADETAASPDTLRLALEIADKRRARLRTRWGRILLQLRQMDFATRRTVASAFLGSLAGLTYALGIQLGDPAGLATIAQIALVGLAVWNLALTRKKELGMLAGAALGASYWVGVAFFSGIIALFQPELRHEVDGWRIIPCFFIGGLLGYLIGLWSDRILQLRFQHDPQKRRQFLLQQLIELQEQLRAGEQSVTFLSVDVEGSTEIKTAADPLAVEYSFGEYTKYVQEVTKRHGGRLHSTAGDGVLLTFEHPHQAFMAARRLQAGMLEFNAFRNRTGEAFQVRCGIHTGTVVAPGGRTEDVNYSHVIDVAAHAQKAAPPGGIAITEDAAVFVPGGPDGISPTRVDVKGIGAVIWQSQAAMAAGPAETPPPPPPVRTN
ncbi:MAG: adenylate/guanylate cyclase domain-containing protein [Armatimonadetes bacterium]|nr:adenylate/guanylate cyclase domain-containing protein [Armatimonadota bacterium]